MQENTLYVLLIIWDNAFRHHILTLSPKTALFVSHNVLLGLEKIKELESARPFRRSEVPDNVTKQRPVFIHPIQNIDYITEGQTAHFEAQLIPIGDPTMKVDWLRNDKLIETSSRIMTSHEFGCVTLT